MKHLQLFEAFKAGVTISVDVQPDYEEAFTFEKRDFGRYINSRKNSVLFLYNGDMTVGELTLREYKVWLRLECKVTENALNRARFVDKGYAFFRDAMDEGYDERDLVPIIRYMMEINQNDVSNLTPAHWSEFLKRGGSEDIHNYFTENMGWLGLPPLVRDLQHIDTSIELLGGGEEACLKEVAILLAALGKPFELNHEFIYY